MNRTAWLAALALIIAPGPTFGQSRFGTVGRTGMDDQRRSGGFRAVGAFGGDAQEETGRSVRLEMEGGQKLEGTIHFRPVIVDSDLGRYTIRPDKIKMIQFLKRANVDDIGPAEVPRDVQGNVNVPRAVRPVQRETRVRGKVVTTSDKVIIGDVHIPFDFALELDFGTLTVAPDKLRTLTMIDAEPADAPKAGARPDGGDRKGDPSRPGSPAAGATGEAGRPGRSGAPGGSQGQGPGGR